MCAELLPKDRWDEIEIGTVTRMVYDDDGQLCRLVVRNSEHLYAVEPDPGPDGEGLVVGYIQPVQGMNRSFSSKGRWLPVEECLDDYARDSE
jgi:hypothetical protein